MLGTFKVMDRISVTKTALRDSAGSRLEAGPGIGPRASAVPEAPQPARFSIADQWARVIGVLQEAQGRARGVVRLQRDAAAQLDAATYALQKLREDIAPAMMRSEGTDVQEPAMATTRREPFRRRQQLAA